VKWVRSPLKVLHWDLENRPLSYMGQDYTSGEITAIAASWSDQARVHVWLLGRHTQEEMIGGFLNLYEQADMVTGHNMRRHDLPVLSGAMLEFGFGRLPAKLCSDTYLDLVKRRHLSVSQESLAGTFGLPHPKEHMSQPLWREANRLTPQGLKHTRRRVAGDVRQHKQLRAHLLELGVLRDPKMWSA